MPTVITGTDGINQVQAGAVESGDLPAGSVIQVVQNVISTSSTGNNSSFVDTGITASITPTSTNSKILISISGSSKHRTTATLNIATVTWAVLRGASIISEVQSQSVDNVDTTHTWGSNLSISYLDSPNTTSSVSYKLQAKIAPSNTEWTIADGNTDSVITLMEIAG